MSQFYKAVEKIIERREGRNATEKRGTVLSVDNNRAMVLIGGSTKAQPVHVLLGLVVNPNDTVILTANEFQNAERWTIDRVLTSSMYGSSVQSYSQTTEVSPPENIRIENLIVNSCVVFWDCPVTTAALFEVAYDTTESELDGTTIALTRGSMAIFEPVSSPLYVHIRTILETGETSEWSAWTVVSTLASTPVEIDVSADTGTPITISPSSGISILGGIGIDTANSGSNLEVTLDLSEGTLVTTLDTALDTLAVSKADNSIARIAPDDLKTELGLVVGTDIQAQNAKLQDVADLAGLTKGDIIVWSGTEFTILTPTVDGQVLSLDSTTATGLKYITASSGSMSGFTISDGTTSDYIENAETITFTDGTGINHVVSAGAVTTHLDIASLTEETVIDGSADFFPFLDTSSGQIRKGKIDNFVLVGGTVEYPTVSAEAGEDLAIRDIAYISPADGKLYKVDTDASPIKIGKVRGMMQAAVSATATGVLVVNGIMEGFTGLTGMAPVYASTTAGGYTQTRPIPTIDAAQVAIAQIGMALDTTTIFINPLPIQYQKRAIFAVNEILEVEHHADSEAYLRKIFGYTQYSTFLTAEHPSSYYNDYKFDIGASYPATYTADQCTGGTASASSVYDANYTAAKAFDNAVGNLSGGRWASLATSVPQWLQYTFSTAKTIRRYTLDIAEATLGGSVTPNSWRLEYYDGAAWQTADTQTGVLTAAWAPKLTFDVATIASSTQWRLYITANNGTGYSTIGEMEMMEVATFSTENIKLAQTFSWSGSSIEKVSLYLRKVGSPTGTGTIRIETVTGAPILPTGTLAHANATLTFSESSLTTSFADTEFTFSTPFTLAAGTYAIVLSTSRSASEFDYIEWGYEYNVSLSSYYSGAAFWNQGSWLGGGSTRDFIFTVTSEGLIRPSKVSVDWWASTHADVVNLYGDESGADESIITSFKCLKTDGFEDLTVVVELD